MECPYCGAEVKEGDTFCGECGKPLRREIEIAPIWKWGSMITSLALVYFPLFGFMVGKSSYHEEALLISLIFGFPATIYLMYKERTKKIKYGLAWIVIPILSLFIGAPYGHWYGTYIDGWTNFQDFSATHFASFILFAIPAIVIDVIYVYKTR